MRPRHLFIAAALTAALGACGGSSSEETVRFTDSVSTIEATSVGGLISIVGDDDATGTTVTTESRYSGDAPSVSVTLENGVLIADDGCGSRTDCDVDFRIVVPPNVDVTATTTDGSMTVNDIIGDVTLATADGNVSLNGIEGSVDVVTVSGSVLGARLESATATVVSDSGNVDLTFNEPVEQVTVTTDSGNATVQVAGEPYNVVTQTVNGSIDIVVDEDAAAPRTITLTTGSGDIKVYRK